jgi:hypothetical protein
MAFQTINLGQIANDGTGDDLRTAFEKIINNFSYLQDQVDDSIFVDNLGDGQPIFKQRTDNVLELRTIDSGTNILLSTEDDKIIVALDIQEDVDVNSKNIINVGSISAQGSITVEGNISVEGLQSKFIGNLIGNVSGDVLGTVYAPIGNFGLQGDVVGRNPDTNLTDPLYSPARVDGVSVKDLNRYATSFNFGSIIDRRITNPLDFFLDQIGMDFGSFTNPTPLAIDAGSIAT